MGVEILVIVITLMIRHHVIDGIALVTKQPNPRIEAAKLAAAKASAATTAGAAPAKSRYGMKNYFADLYEDACVGARNMTVKAQARHAERKNETAEARQRRKAAEEIQRHIDKANRKEKPRRTWQQWVRDVVAGNQRPVRPQPQQPAPAAERPTHDAPNVETPEPPPSETPRPTPPPPVDHEPPREGKDREKGEEPSVDWEELLEQFRNTHKPSADADSESPPKTIFASAERMDVNTGATNGHAVPAERLAIAQNDPNHPVIEGEIMIEADSDAGKAMARGEWVATKSVTYGGGQAAPAHMETGGKLGIMTAINWTKQAAVAPNQIASTVDNAIGLFLANKVTDERILNILNAYLEGAHTLGRLGTDLHAEMSKYQILVETSASFRHGQGDMSVTEEL